MNKPRYLVASLAALSAMVLVGEQTLGQQPRPAACPVAILDLTYIFKNHVRFQQMSNELRRDVDAAEQLLKNERDSYQKLFQQLETTYKKGTPEYKSMEEELAKRAADLQLKVNIQKKEFLEREAKIYFNVYQEVIEKVRYYSDSNGIALVLRFNGDPIDRTDPQEVLKELNKSVIHYNRGIDITPIVLEMCNREAPKPGGAAPGIQGGGQQLGMPQGGFQPGAPGLPPRR